MTFEEKIAKTVAEHIGTDDTMTMIGVLDMVKFSIMSGTMIASRNARSLCGDGATARPEGEKVSG